MAIIASKIGIITIIIICIISLGLAVKVIQRYAPPPLGGDKTAFEEVRDEYYSLPKVIPGTNGMPVIDGYDGLVVRWDGTKEVRPRDLKAKYDKKTSKKEYMDEDKLNSL